MRISAGALGRLQHIAHGKVKFEIVEAAPGFEGETPDGQAPLPWESPGRGTRDS